MIVINKLVTVIAVSMIMFGGMYLHTETAAETAKPISVRSTNTVQSMPKTFSVATSKAATPSDITAIQIPRLGIDLTVKNGYYNSHNRTWTLDKTHAFLIKSSATPIIYGHNRPNVFRPLNNIAENDLLYIQDSMGSYVYRYAADSIVKPSDTRILETKTENTIYLLTCTGSNFENRRILAFTFVTGQAS
jgi:LPXTG-site transpeptidase (sortase) family protein